MNQLIFITGIGRSRTTLVQNLFWAFKNTVVIPGETRAFSLVVNNLRKVGGFNLVAKRKAGSFLNGMRYGFSALFEILYIKKYDIKLIYCARNKEDVLKSKNGIIPEKNYNRSIRRYNRCKFDIIYIDTDELIKEPDIMQEFIANKLNLKIKHRWSEYPDFVPENIFNYPVKKGSFTKREIK